MSTSTTGTESTSNHKILYAPDNLDEVVSELEQTIRPLPQRLDTNPSGVEKGLAKLVLTLIELIRQLMERQALRRIEGGALSDEEIERLGETFLKLAVRMEELKQIFGLENEDLNLDLGPLGNLM